MDRRTLTFTDRVIAHKNVMPASIRHLRKSKEIRQQRFASLAPVTNNERDSKQGDYFAQLGTCQTSSMELLG